MGKPYGRSYVLITGATTGIGYELAKLYANDGNNLIFSCKRWGEAREGKRRVNITI